MTTLASVFLIAFHNRDTSLEAAWKFLMLGSLGLGFALLGTVLLFASARERLAKALAALHWTQLHGRHAPELHPFTLRLGVVFALIGYGTRPDWRRCNVETRCISRGAVAGRRADGGRHVERRAVLSLAHPFDFEGALGPDFSGGLLLTLGLLSVLVAMPFILIQWNSSGCWRTPASSSRDHGGRHRLGAEAAVFGALLHMTYHSLAKPVAFFSAGTLAQLHSSSELRP